MITIEQGVDEGALHLTVTKQATFISQPTEEGTECICINNNSIPILIKELEKIYDQQKDGKFQY